MPGAFTVRPTLTGDRQAGFLNIFLKPKSD